MKNKQLHIKTPSFISTQLSRIANKEIVLKFDNMQPSGSFKLRGVGFACQEYVKQGATHLVSSSGGNAGLAVAYAGRILGVRVTVVVPETTTESAKQKIRLENANIITFGSSWVEANEHAFSLLSEDKAFIHPFDDPLLWTGHSTIIDELVDDGVAFDAIALSVGGGGLLSGVVEGLCNNQLSHIPVITVETQGADSFYQSFHNNDRVNLVTIESAASSLGAKQISQQAFDLIRQHPIIPVLVSDAEASQACDKFLLDHRQRVELACGATLSVVYQNHEVLEPFERIAVIVCGGVVI